MRKVFDVVKSPWTIRSMRFSAQQHSLEPSGPGRFGRTGCLRVSQADLGAKMGRQGHLNVGHGENDRSNRFCDAYKPALTSVLAT